jgi:hypothetical protein
MSTQTSSIPAAIRDRTSASAQPRWTSTTVLCVTSTPSSRVSILVLLHRILCVRLFTEPSPSVSFFNDCPQRLQLLRYAREQERASLPDSGLEEKDLLNKRMPSVCASRGAYDTRLSPTIAKISLANAMKSPAQALIRLSRSRPIVSLNVHQSRKESGIGHWIESLSLPMGAVHPSLGFRSAKHCPKR